ncbi:MAG TPA: hypothetical protein DEF01_00970 [Gemmatimonadetes bacterium]|nr:hypothetical protein [Gemmatimonadota bacterium]HBV05279.1 hypothetical protein [Gemmatimonadota bacterium]HCO14257.1 hypothetical protein [Gemmatimonadota bacterium]
MKNRNLDLVLLLTLFASLACSAEPSPPAEAVMASIPDTLLSVVTEIGVRNARMPMDRLVTSGQPTQEQIRRLQSSGIEHFVSLRPTTEDGAGWEEELLVGEGVQFDRLPISGSGSLTRDNVEAFAAILDEVGEKTAMLYCASSNRVGAMLALKAHWVDGESAEEALELGLASGLTSLERSVRDLLDLGSNTP